MEILEQNYTIAEIKISLDRNNSKMEKRQRKKISELEHSVIVIIQSEQYRETCQNPKLISKFIWNG